MIALAYLNRELIELLRALALNALLPDRPSRISFEVFLAGLCEAHPHEMGRQFRNPERIEELVRKHKPRPLRHIRADELNERILEGAATAGIEIPSERPGTVPAFSIQMEPRLVTILEKAVRLAQEGHLARAGIPQFVEAFSSEEDLLTSLFIETGLILRTDDRS
jgi:hypothetical protein